MARRKGSKTALAGNTGPGGAARPGGRGRPARSGPHGPGPKARHEASAGAGATTGYEAELWAVAEALRGLMDAAAYKHVVLGLIFLKYISDAFEERHAAVLAEWGGEAAEDRDEYTAENIFWVPPEARWAQLKAAARQATVGRLVDDAMAAIERDNPSLKDVLPRDYARPALDKQRLGQLIDLVSNIRVGDEDARSRDVPGRVYEYFLSRFASAERPSPRTWRHWVRRRCGGKEAVLTVLHPQWRSRLQVSCAGKSTEIAVDRIRTIGKQRLRRRLDRLSSEPAAHLRHIITEMYGE